MKTNELIMAISIPSGIIVLAISMACWVRFKLKKVRKAKQRRLDLKAARQMFWHKGLSSAGYRPIEPVDRYPVGPGPNTSTANLSTSTQAPSRPGILIRQNRPSRAIRWARNEATVDPYPLPATAGGANANTSYSHGRTVSPNNLQTPVPYRPNGGGFVGDAARARGGWTTEPSDVGVPVPYRKMYASLHPHEEGRSTEPSLGEVTSREEVGGVPNPIPATAGGANPRGSGHNHEPGRAVPPINLRTPAEARSRPVLRDPSANAALSRLRLPENGRQPSGASILEQLERDWHAQAIARAARWARNEAMVNPYPHLSNSTPPPADPLQESGRRPGRLILANGEASSGLDDDQGRPTRFVNTHNIPPNPQEPNNPTTAPESQIAGTTQRPTPPPPRAVLDRVSEMALDPNPDPIAMQEMLRSLIARVNDMDSRVNEMGPVPEAASEGERPPPYSF